MLEIENQHNFEVALRNQINLFVGAGFSVLAKNKFGDTLPTGIQLKEDLASKFAMADVESLSLSQLCTIIESTSSEEFRAFIVDKMTVVDHSEKYLAIDKLDINSIFTTNVDDLLLKIYSKSDRHYSNDVYIKGPHYGDSSGVDILPLHGSIYNSDRRMTFGSAETASAFDLDPTHFRYLVARLKKSPTIFWGYKLADSGILNAIAQAMHGPGEQPDRWIVIPEKYLDANTRKFFKALRFQIIVSSTEEFLDYLLELSIAPSSSHDSSVHSGKLEFPEFSVPELGKAPARPIREFYEGAAPVWSDIFQSQLFRTSHYDEIRNHVNAGKTVVITGVPACGKTTLLMQLAASMSYEGIKLIMDFCSKEKALTIINLLRSRRALIFLDNISDSVEAFDEFRAHENIRIISADREYNYEIVSHLVSHGSTIIDVTELTAQDKQELRKRIPDAVRRVRAEHFEVTDRPTSIFELIQEEVNFPRLNERYSSVFQQLEESDWRLTDLLLVVCYLHSCRTPCALDTLIGYFERSVRNYEEIHELIARLGSLVTDYSGQFMDTNQDYFSPRSNIVSEAVLRQSPADALRRMLKRFRQNVRPWQIPRYDIFKRYAYDRRLAERAFPNWLAGRDYYEEIFEETRSPWVRQQGALYLSRKEQHQLAFQWIDQAVNMTNYDIWSIRNSHAVILYRANINQNPSNPTVQESLKNSMQILARCYSSDKRKLFHALTFAEQAIGYRDVFGLTREAKEYLEQANLWLEEEASLQSTNRVRVLRKQIREKLSNTIQTDR
ncbi:SIR2 family protein [bacterium]|nr:SIR2 family protein [bacterium]